MNERRGRMANVRVLLLLKTEPEARLRRHNETAKVAVFSTRHIQTRHHHGHAPRNGTPPRAWHVYRTYRAYRSAQPRLREPLARVLVRAKTAFPVPARRLNSRNLRHWR